MSKLRPERPELSLPQLLAGPFHQHHSLRQQQNAYGLDHLKQSPLSHEHEGSREDRLEELR